MAESEAKEIKGSVSISRNTTVGGNTVVRGSVAVGHNLRVDGWLDAPNIKGACKGLFRTEQELKNEYPVPEGGWFALVGDTLPATVWVAESGKWIQTEGTGGDFTLYPDYLERLLSNEVNNRKESLTELLGRIQGSSDDSKAYTDPFMLKEFSGWEEVKNFVDNTVPSSLSTYGGTVRIKENGTWLVTLQTAIRLNSNTSKTYWQRLEGFLVIKDDGTYAISGTKHAYERTRIFSNGETTGEWEELAVFSAQEKARLSTLVSKDEMHQSAYSDDYIVLGSFDSMEELNAALDGMAGEGVPTADAQKYCGRVRAKVNGVNIEVYQFVVNYASKHFTQIAFGNFRVALNDASKLSQTGGTFAILTRSCADGIWGNWAKYGAEGGGDGSLDPIYKEYLDKKISEEFESKFDIATLTADPNPIQRGVNRSVSLRATVTNTTGNRVEYLRLLIGSSQIASGTDDSLSTSRSANNTFTVTARVKLVDYSKVKEKALTVNAYYPIYLGASAKESISAEDFLDSPTVKNPVAVQNMTGLNATDTYVLGSVGIGGNNFYDKDTDQMIFTSALEYGCVVQLEGFSQSTKTAYIKQLIADKYYQALSNRVRVSLGTEKVPFTISEADGSYYFRLEASDLYLNAVADVTPPYPIGAEKRFTGNNSMWFIFNVDVNIPALRMYESIVSSAARTYTFDVPEGGGYVYLAVPDGVAQPKSMHGWVDGPAIDGVVKQTISVNGVLYTVWRSPQKQSAGTLQVQFK